jgi:hypothetical protein
LASTVHGASCKQSGRQGTGRSSLRVGDARGAGAPNIGRTWVAWVPLVLLVVTLAEVTLLQLLLLLLYGFRLVGQAGKASGRACTAGT